MAPDTATVVIASGHDWLDFVSAIGTVGAAAVAALAVRQTGRQGRAQQRQLLAARERDIAERRADFELELLLQISRGARHAFGWRNNITPTEEENDVKALLLALPPDLLPVLRAMTAPLDDTLAEEVLTPFKGSPSFRRDVQRAIDREIRDAIFERRDLDIPPAAGA